MESIAALQSRLAEIQQKLEGLQAPNLANTSASFSAVMASVQGQSPAAAGATGASAPAGGSTTPISGGATAPVSGGATAPAGGGATVSPALQTKGTMTPTSWATDLLSRMGMPTSASNVAAMVGWEKAEGGNWSNSAAFNPLNTTQRAGGSSSMNSVGVQSYPSYETGMQATITTLNNGHYGAILGALRSGTSAQAVRDAVVSSPWGTGAGAFPVSLLAGA